jgi:hypothetical protein
MNTTTRRIVTIPGGWLGCSNCGWRATRSKVGAWGHTSGKARMAVVRAAFGSHRCWNYEEKA